MNDASRMENRESREGRSSTVETWSPHKPHPQRNDPQTATFCSSGPAYDIPYHGNKTELGTIKQLNDNSWRRTKDNVAAKYWETPEGRGYKPHEVQSELYAEAIRAYLQDPNYIKTVAPKTAAVIRKFVNTDPRLSQIIHFNSLLPAATLGGAALSGTGLADGDAEEQPQDQKRSSFYRLLYPHSE